MIDPKRIEDLAGSLAGILPPGLKSLRAELQDNFRAVLHSHLEKLDLVSRERFDVQTDVLSRLQAKLKLLEARVQALETHKTSE